MSFCMADVSVLPSSIWLPTTIHFDYIEPLACKIILKVNIRGGMANKRKKIY